ncbi:methyltransferase, partial [Flavobacterium silvisoli]
DEIIRPILRGRDIKKYDIHFSNLYLINAHNGVKEKGTKRIDVVNDYPVIYEHLKHFQSKLESRSDKGDHWSNLRNCAYIDIFTGPKLIYPETMRLLKNNNETFPRFTYDSGNYFCDKTAFSITGVEIKYLLAFMNSKIMEYLIPQYVTAWDDSGFMMQKIYLENIPIPNPEKKIKDSIEILVDKILIEEEILKKKELQHEIDKIFSGIFNFSEDEEVFINLIVRN